jgi:hypothetical protein
MFGSTLYIKNKPAVVDTPSVAVSVPSVLGVPAMAYVCAVFSIRADADMWCSTVVGFLL